MSGLNDDITNNCTSLFYKITLEKKKLIVCLRLYVNELNNIFLTIPNSIFLLYDKTSEESFNIISSYYNEIIETNKFDNTKFILVGTKKDLIHEEEDENKEDDNSLKNGKNKTFEDKINEDKGREHKEKENKENEDNKNIFLSLNDKIKAYCKEKKIILNKEISGLNGEGVKELFEDVIKILYFDIKNMENDAKVFDVGLNYYKDVENEINLSTKENSYHSDEYKKEINRINKKRKVYLCCYRCSIF